MTRDLPTSPQKLSAGAAISTTGPGRMDCAIISRICGMMCGLAR